MKKEETSKINSLYEFEKKYFPKAFKKENEKADIDANELGIRMAKESLSKVKENLQNS